MISNGLYSWYKYIKKGNIFVILIWLNNIIPYNDFYVFGFIEMNIEIKDISGSREYNGLEDSPDDVF